ncbi:hypothetical protein ACFL20_12665 [Spirochaetota bacterium]
MKKSTISFITIGIFILTMTAVMFSGSVEKTDVYAASKFTLNKFKRIKLGGSPKQVKKRFGKPHGTGSSGSSSSISYYQKSKKTMVEITFRIQKVKGKEIITGKSWNENLR